MKERLGKVFAYALLATACFGTTAIAGETCQTPQVLSFMEEAIRADPMLQGSYPSILSSRTIFENYKANMPGSAVLACAVTLQLSWGNQRGSVAFYPTAVPDVFRAEWSGIGPAITR